MTDVKQQVLKRFEILEQLVTDCEITTDEETRTRQAVLTHFMTLAASPTTPPPPQLTRPTVWEGGKADGEAATGPRIQVCAQCHHPRKNHDCQGPCPGHGPLAQGLDPDCLKPHAPHQQDGGVANEEPSDEKEEEEETVDEEKQKRKKKLQKQEKKHKHKEEKTKQKKSRKPAVASSSSEEDEEEEAPRKPVPLPVLPEKKTETLKSNKRGRTEEKGEEETAAPAKNRRKTEHAKAL